MKRLTMLAMLCLIVGLLPANVDTVLEKPFSLTLMGGGRTFTGDIYNTINPAVGIDLGFELKWSLMPFVHAGYISASGELSYTKEPTTLIVIPIEAGIRYLMSAGNITPYIGGGGGFYLLKEDNIIGKVNESGFGFFGEAGVRINLAAAFFVDIRAKYSALSIRIQDASRNLGGFLALAGVGLMF